jgi:predicted DNA binding CopG/RHH family protein
MRIKVTMSLQKDDLKRIDKRAKALNLTRSAYLRSLVNRDLTAEIVKVKRRITDYAA